MPLVTLGFPVNYVHNAICFVDVSLTFMVKFLHCISMKAIVYSRAWPLNCL